MSFRAALRSCGKRLRARGNVSVGDLLRMPPMIFLVGFFVGALATSMLGGYPRTVRQIVGALVIIIGVFIYSLQIDKRT